MRGILMVLGIYFHIAVFNYIDDSIFFGIFFVQVHYFRMPAFFLISGFFGALFFYKRGAKKMLTNRFKRIFLPLIILLPPVHTLIVFSAAFSKLKKDHNTIDSLIKALKSLDSYKDFIPIDTTHHLWFLYYLSFIIIIAFLIDKTFDKSRSSGNLRKTSLLLFNRPWFGTLLLCFSFGMLMAIMEKPYTQGEGVPWGSWLWFLTLSSIKSFIAFCFFYFVGWQIYHHRSLLLNLKVRRYFILFVPFYIITFSAMSWLMKIDLSPYDPWNSFFKKESTNKQEVTFIIDMSAEVVKSGEGEYPAVYVSAGIGDSPSGLEMKDIGNGLWTITTELNRGVHTYFFRNGLYSNWDDFGWENTQKIIDGGCNYGKHNIRRFRVEDKDLTLGVFCWSECNTCDGENIPMAYFKENNLVKRTYIFIWNMGVPLMVIFWLAVFVRLFNKPSKTLRYISDSSYWIYIIHQPLAFFVPAFFHQIKISVYLKFIISSILVTIICFLSYHFFVRKTFIGHFLNGRKYD